MGRSRSRSPTSKRERGERKRSRSRERRRTKKSDMIDLTTRKKRSRSRSPRRRNGEQSSQARHRSPSPRGRSLSPRRRSRERSESLDKKNDEVIVIDESKLEGLDDEQVDMMKLMGFANFDTTKDKKVENNENGAVNLQRKRRYRQYMNRRGGFNRPLDFVA